MRDNLRRLALGCLWLAAAVVAQVGAVRADGPRTIVVDGSIQAAIDSIPADNVGRVVVEIPDGVYNERFRIDQDRVTLRGASRAGTRIEFNFPRSEYDKRYDRLGPGVVNLFGDDCVVERLMIHNTQPSREHAFAVYGQPDRLVIDNCDILGVGGDTLSLWNTAFGRYYHRNCRFQGRVDFVCPRGWCFVRDCSFEETDRTAVLWHDGHMDPRMKFVLRGCTFDGVKDYWLGRNHYPSQFYLLGCRFSANMADKPIGTVKEIDALPPEEQALFDRRYFHDCHRDGGDYAWHADNLSTAEGAPTPDDVTAAWAFDHRWDPESDAAPTVEEVEVEGDAVHVRFSEPVAGCAGATIVRADGGVARFERGDGAARVVFRGGGTAAPRRLEPAGPESLYGCVASLAMRYVAPQDLPEAAPREGVVVLVIGDSTVADYPAERGMQGWGWGLRAFFDERVTVLNAARGGRSSKSFRDEGLWEEALAEAERAGGADWVLIQFGHNDNPGKGPERETDPALGGDFRANVRRYVDEARAAGATPVVLTPPRRRNFTEAGRLRPTGKNAPYAEASRSVAFEAICATVDLRRLTTDLFNGLGPATSDKLQPEGDLTHFTPTGARRLAGLVLTSLQERLPELRRYIVQDRLTRP